jgi:DNA polymerase I-like protein with 3'-5' exonuclease and polymerase domains
MATPATRVTIGGYRCPFELWTPAMGKVFDGMMAYDTETTEIDDERPELVPSLVLATACDGKQGNFITPEVLLDFFRMHRDATIICHNAAFDMKVTQKVLGDRFDVYEKVDNNQLWDTLVLRRLLSLATEGHTAQGESSLAEAAAEFLGVDLKKHLKDIFGHRVRTGFGRFLYQPFAAIPGEYRQYAATDALVTWHLFFAVYERIRQVLAGARKVWGFVDDAWLRDAIAKFGPLTHHVQLRASILMDVLTRNGIGLDADRQSKKLQQVLRLKEDCERRLLDAGLVVSGKESVTTVQALLDGIHAEHPDVPLARTDSEKRWSTSKESLAELAEFDPRLMDLVKFKAAEKLASTYLSKMNGPRLHAKFGYLVRSGRTNCGGGFNLQNLPKENGLDTDPEAVLLRSCFVPRYSSTDNGVLIDDDLSQIELVVLAYAFKYQFGLGTVLFDLINSGEDVHKRIAAVVLVKDPSDVTKAERNSAKPVSFGRPGGMGVDTLQKIAKNNYGQELTHEEVQERIDAYHRLCPELNKFLDDEVNVGQVIADALQLDVASYYEARDGYPPAEIDGGKTDWLGWMLLKVLREGMPCTEGGRPYSVDELAYFWSRAQGLAPRLPPNLVEQLQQRQAGEELWEAVKDSAGRRPMITLTGRLRANATFCASRNTVFQGVAADGAILGLWLVWRASHKLVSFVHDQIVVESPADDNVPAYAQEIESLMRQGMLMVVPGMNVKVETVITQSLNKADLDPRYQPRPSSDAAPLTASPAAIIESSPSTR